MNSMASKTEEHDASDWDALRSKPSREGDNEKNKSEAKKKEGRSDSFVGGTGEGRDKMRIKRRRRGGFLRPPRGSGTKGGGAEGKVRLGLPSIRKGARLGSSPERPLRSNQEEPRSKVGSLLLRDIPSMSRRGAEIQRQHRCVLVISIPHRDLVPDASRWGKPRDPIPVPQGSFSTDARRISLLNPYLLHGTGSRTNALCGSSFSRSIRLCDVQNGIARESLPFGLRRLDGWGWLHNCRIP